MNILEVIKKRKLSDKGLIAIKNENQSISYEELFNLIVNIQEYIHEKYEKKIVILKEENQLDFIINFFSCISNGNVVIPISDKVTETKITEIENDVGAVVFEEKSFICYDKYKIERLDDDLLIPDENEVGIIQMTSGSTGKSKYCYRTIGAITLEARNFTDAYSLNHNDVVLSTCPLNHSFAFGAAFFTSFYSGAVFMAINKMNPTKIVKMIEEYKITYLLMVPDIARMLCLAQRKLNIQNICLRVPLVGAGYVSNELYKNFFECFKIAIYCNYGSTETGAVMTQIDNKCVSSVGKPMRGVKFKLKDITGKNIESHEGKGILWVKSNTMMKKYWNDECAFDDDGFYCMNDIIYHDHYDNYYVKGRTKPLIKISGISINPNMVEEIICKYTGVKECIVYEQKTENRNYLVAMVSGIELTDQKLREHCAVYMQSASIPSKFIITNELPRNELGKIRVIT